MIIPEELSNSMKKEFNQSYGNFAGAQFIDIDYHDFKKLYQNLKADEDLKLYPILFGPKNDASKYPQLTKFTDKFFLAAESGGKFYSFHNAKIFEIKQPEFLTMMNIYAVFRSKNLDPVIHRENTNYILLDKKHLEVYIPIGDYAKAKKIRFNFAMVPTEKLADFIIQKLPPKMVENLKTKWEATNAGQITVITDAFNEKGSPIGELSNYDINKLCPFVCPGTGGGKQK